MPGYDSGRCPINVRQDVKFVRTIICSNTKMDEYYEKLLYFVNKEDIEIFKEKEYPDINVRCTMEVWENIRLHLGVDVMTADDYLIVAQ